MIAAVTLGHLKVVFVPRYKSRNPLADRDRRMEADRLLQLTDVRARGDDVARLHRQQIELRFLAQRVFERGDVVEEKHRAVVADVEDSIRRVAAGGIGIVAAPVRIGFGALVEYADHAFDDVVDVGEVADHAPFVVDGNRFAGQDAARETEESHVRPAPRSVHGEESQAGRGDAEEMRIRVRHQLVRFFRGRVQRDGMIDVVVLGEGLLRIRAVHGARRRVDEMLDGVMAASLEDVQEAGDVALGVRVRVRERVADARLRGKMNDALRLVTREQLLDRGTIGDVAAHELETLELAKDIQPGMLQRRIVVVVEVVDAGDVFAPLEQSFRYMEADEAGRARYENQSVNPAFRPSS